MKMAPDIGFGYLHLIVPDTYLINYVGISLIYKIILIAIRAGRLFK